MSGRFTSTKTYRNLPCCHRQWQHKGHCKFVHGYSRELTFHFECTELNECDFVVDYGSLKELEAALMHQFDHTCLINADDPLLDMFKDLHSQDVIDLRVMESVSMEGTAKWALDLANKIVQKNENGRAKCFKVECRENDKNSATFELSD